MGVKKPARGGLKTAQKICALELQWRHWLYGLQCVFMGWRLVDHWRWWRWWRWGVLVRRRVTWNRTGPAGVWIDVAMGGVVIIDGGIRRGSLMRGDVRSVFFSISLDVDLCSGSACGQYEDKSNYCFHYLPSFGMGACRFALIQHHPGRGLFPQSPHQLERDYDQNAERPPRQLALAV
jgi:hypothetical protein